MPSKDFTSKRPILLTQLMARGERLWDGVIAQADAYGWRLRELGMTSNIVAADIHPIGAIVTDLPGSPVVNYLQGRGIPVVRLGLYPHPQDHRVPAVLPDLSAAGRLAANHFVNRKFKHVGYVGFRPWHNMRTLFQQFQKQALNQECECHLLQLRDTKRKCYDPASRAEKWAVYQRQIMEWISHLPRPLGILACNDFMGANICEWVIEANLMVPDDVAILGYGNQRYACRVAPVTLSSIEPNAQACGREAVQLLKRLIEGQQAHDIAPVQIIPAKVVERQSTHILAVPDPVVAKALRFIWDHFRQQELTVDRIAAEAGVCRRTLERGFSRYLKRSVASEIRRKRLEVCAELLKNTDFSTAEIARKIGFSTGNYLHRAFTKAYSMTPGHYRKSQTGE